MTIGHLVNVGKTNPKRTQNEPKRTQNKPKMNLNEPKRTQNEPNQSQIIFVYVSGNFQADLTL